MKRFVLALGVLIAVGCSGPEPAPALPPTSTAPVATFNHPQPLGFVWWSFPRGEAIRAVELRFTLPEYTASDGLHLALLQGQLQAPGEAVGADFSFGLRTAIPDRGKGLVFSGWGAEQPSQARPAAGGWSPPPDPERAGRGVGNGFVWAPGPYLARLEWRRTNPAGSWYGVVLRHELSGDLFDAGELRFARGATIQPVVGCALEVTSGATTEADLPAFELLLEPPRAEGALPFLATSAYGELTHVDVRIDAKNGRSRVRIGGETRLRHGAGRFDLSGLTR